MYTSERTGAGDSVSHSYKIKYKYKYNTKGRRNKSKWNGNGHGNGNGGYLNTYTKPIEPSAKPKSDIHSSSRYRKSQLQTQTTTATLAKPQISGQTQNKTTLSSSMASIFGSSNSGTSSGNMNKSSGYAPPKPFATKASSQSIGGFGGNNSNGIARSLSKLLLPKKFRSIFAISNKNFNDVGSVNTNRVAIQEGL